MLAIIEKDVQSKYNPSNTPNVKEVKPHWAHFLSS
jgi:hypothetical protein